MSRENPKSSMCTVGDKREMSKNMNHLNEIGDLVTQDKEKVEVLTDLFASVLTGKSSSHML